MIGANFVILEDRSGFKVLQFYLNGSSVKTLDERSVVRIQYNVKVEICIYLLVSNTIPKIREDLL